jgi:hypothetical protein
MTEQVFKITIIDFNISYLSRLKESLAASVV